MNTNIEKTPPVFFKEFIAQEQLPAGPQKGVIYARYSSVLQDSSESIEVQLRACLKYAHDNDILIVREPFIDRAETGTSTENRKAYQELLEHARQRFRDFDIVLTFHTSRWGRGFESEIDEYQLGKNGVKIIAVSQPFTADDAVESVFMKGVLRKIDAYYSMQASKYTHAYQSSNARNGFKNGGPPADGYAMEYLPTGKKDKRGKERTKSRLILNMKHGEHDLTETPRHKVIEFAFLNAYQGRGIRWLAKEIREKGWRSRREPKPIPTSTVRAWLINPIYTGYMVWNRVKFFRKNGKRSYKHNPINQWVFSDETSHPAIISKEIFESVAMKFMRRSTRGIGRPPENGSIPQLNHYNSTRYLLSGLMECSKCKVNYVVVKTNHKGKASQVYFGCNAKERWGKKECTSKRINIAVLEGTIMDTLLNRLLNEQTIRQFIQACNEFLDTSKESLSEHERGLRDQLERLEKEINNMKQAIIAGANPNTFVDDLRTRQNSADKLHAELHLLKDAKSAQKLEFDSDSLATWIEKLKGMIITADFETRIEMVRKFIKKIVISPDKTAKITWDPFAVLNFDELQRGPSDINLDNENSLRGRSSKSLSQSYPKKRDNKNSLREVDLNHRPRGYEPRELPGCSIPRGDYSLSSIILGRFF